MEDIKESKLKDQTDLNNRINTAKETADKLDGYRAELEQSEEILSRYKKTHDLLISAKNHLEKANNTLKNNFVAPIQREFMSSPDILTEILGSNYSFDPNLKLMFERNGKSWSEQYLSSGQRSLCALCFRLALIKVIYKNDPPFILLDDPFGTLDEQNLRHAVSLLTTLAPNLQIIYLTCHPSRII